MNLATEIRQDEYYSMDIKKGTDASQGYGSIFAWKGPNFSFLAPPGMG